MEKRKSAYRITLPEQLDYTMNDTEVIRFKAQVSQVKTMADGGLRVVLDLPETAIEQIGQLLEVKQAGGVLEIAAVPLSGVVL